MAWIEVLAGGVFTVVGVLIGAWLTTVQGTRDRATRRTGVATMIAHELRTNVMALQTWQAGTDLPVRSNYLWDALRSEAASLLTPAEVTRIADFYYQQATVYKQRPPARKLVDDLITSGNAALHELGHARGPRDDAAGGG